MLEYVFFNDSFRLQFVARLESLGLSHEDAIDPIEGAAIVRIEEPDDGTWDLLDDYYDELSDADQAELENSADDAMSTAGIYIELSDGRKTLAKVRPEVMNRMLASVSMDEFNEFVEIIVKSVEEPDDSPICKKA
jgi:hypothetical protein